jgi:mannose-6-phosphate isomerase-like protein (cupin superfamily)
MPVFKSGPGLAPDWCELEYFDVVRLSGGDEHTFPRIGEKEKLAVGLGSCEVQAGDRTIEAPQGTTVDLDTPGAQFHVSAGSDGCTLVRMAGRWGEETGGCGVFETEPGSASAENRGDPASYPRETSFDRHYHDCDEYWIILEGRAVAVTEGKRFEVGPGDCVATGMGHHHDLPVVEERVRAVYFETTMEGRKRGGHLWEHTHGPAEPKPERV